RERLVFSTPSPNARGQSKSWPQRCTCRDRRWCAGSTTSSASRRPRISPAGGWSSRRGSCARASNRWAASPISSATPPSSPSRAPSRSTAASHRGVTATGSRALSPPDTGGLGSRDGASLQRARAATFYDDFSDTELERIAEFWVPAGSLSSSTRSFGDMLYRGGGGRPAWSIYGAERTQPTATDGGTVCSAHRSNEPIRNRRQPSATVQDRMVRRGSTVRV